MEPPVPHLATPPPVRTISGSTARGSREDGSYSPKVSSLNILPSRQNIFWDGSPHPHGLVPGSGHLYSADSMARAVSGSSMEASLLEWRSLGDSPSECAREHFVDSLTKEDELSLREAVFNLSNTVLGVGVLSVPYAFRLSGYFSIVLVVVVIAVTARTAMFIGAALVLAERSPVAASVPRRGRDFAFLAHVAFGDLGRVVIGAVTSLEIWFALVTFMVMNGVNASLVWPGISRAEAILLSSLLSAALVFVPMRVFSYLSLVSTLSLLVAMGAMLAAALTMLAWANPYDHIGQPALIQLQNFPRSVGIIVFCFAGHPCFPIVHECMVERSKWRASVYITFLLAFLYYGGLGVFGYLVFGMDLAASFTENLAQLENALLCRSVSAIAFFVKIQLTAPLLMNAILVSIWAPRAGEPEWPAERLLALAALMAVTALTAVAFSDDIAVIASLTGSLFTMMTSVLFPTVAHLRLAEMMESNGSRSSRVPHFLVIAFGVVMAVLGTAFAVKDMLE